MLSGFPTNQLNLKIMYYIYYMEQNKKKLIDFGKYYKSAEEAYKRLTSLCDRYRRKCLIGYVPPVG